MYLLFLSSDLSATNSQYAVLPFLSMVLNAADLMLSFNLSNELVQTMRNSSTVYTSLSDILASVYSKLKNLRNYTMSPLFIKMPY